MLWSLQLKIDNRFDSGQIANSFTFTCMLFRVQNWGLVCNIVDVIYSFEKILTFLKFDFAPSINLSDNIRQVYCIMSNRYMTRCLNIKYFVQCIKVSG